MSPMSNSESRKRLTPELDHTCPATEALARVAALCDAMDEIATNSVAYVARIRAILKETDR